MVKYIVVLRNNRIVIYVFGALSDKDMRDIAEKAWILANK